MDHVISFNCSLSTSIVVPVVTIAVRESYNTMRTFRKLVRKDGIILSTCVLFLLATVIVVRSRLPKPKTWSFTHDVIMEPGVSDAWTSARSVLVCVSSAAVNRERRAAIRETWGSHPSLRVLFFFGFEFKQQAKLIEEAQIHGDIVQYDFVDGHRNATLKTTSMIHWAQRHRWPHRTHVLKIDDDTFLNTRLLFMHLDNYFNAPALYGSCFEDIEPVRNPASEYYVSWDEYQPARFPPYLSGALYLLHEQVIESISTEMCEVDYLAMEDVYITGLVADRAHVKKISFPENARLLDVAEYEVNRLTAWFYGEVNLELSTVLGVHFAAPALQRIYWLQLKDDVRRASTP